MGVQQKLHRPVDAQVLQKMLGVDSTRVAIRELLAGVQHDVDRRQLLQVDVHPALDPLPAAADMQKCALGQPGHPPPGASWSFETVALSIAPSVQGTGRVSRRR